ncbi:MAG: hypothetical protein JNL83_19855 [Myxococcales bacterium]|nr:hypothetical protein [Myxococcales bacterium]
MTLSKTSMLATLMLAACGSPGGGASNDEEVITTLVLSFAPTGGGVSITAEFDDPDGEGGQAGTAQPINLAAGSYTLTVGFQNRLEAPPEEITDEVRDEQEFHLVLFTGTAVAAAGPLTHSYGDQDANGLPVGLTSSVMARAGTGQLTVTLRHMPPEEPPVKAADTVMLAKQNGIETLGGSTDATATFLVTVP